MAISNLVTSPYAVCYINSIPFARCCGLNYSILSPKKEIRGIDLLQPIELIPTSLSVYGTIQVYKLRVDGGAEAAGLIATWQKMTKEKYFSLMVLDRSTDSVLIQSNRCSVLDQNWSIQPKNFVTGTIKWSGIDYMNEAE